MVVAQTLSSELCSQGLDAITVPFPEEAFSSTAVDADLYDTDEFRMYCFKVLPCSKRYSHDWTTCPFAHPAEKARRRDPRVCQYTAIACPEMKKDMICPRGKTCPYSHNDFEYWLHPSRYRTQLCNDGLNCRRKVCFFAHQPMELRVPAYQPVLPDITHDSHASHDYSLPVMVTADRSSFDLQDIDSLLPNNPSTWPLSVSGLAHGTNLAAVMSDSATSERMAGTIADQSPRPSLEQVVHRSSLEQMARAASLEQMARRSSLEQLTQRLPLEQQMAHRSSLEQQMAHRSSLEQVAHRLANVSLTAQQVDQANALLTRQAVASSAHLLQQQQLSAQSSQQAAYWASHNQAHRRSSQSSSSNLPPTIHEDSLLSKPDYGGNPEVAYQSSLYAPTSGPLDSRQVAPSVSAAEALLRQVNSQPPRRHSLDSATRMMSARLLPPQSQPQGYRHSLDVINSMQHPLLQSALPVSAALLMNQQLPMSMSQAPAESAKDLLANSDAGYMGYSSSHDEQQQYLLQPSNHAANMGRWLPQQLPGAQGMVDMDLLRLMASIQQKQ